MVGDFNNRGFDWKRGLSLPNCHFYCINFTGMRLLPPHVYLAFASALMMSVAAVCLSWSFLTFIDLGIISVKPGIAKPATQHPSLIIDIPLFVVLETARNTTVNLRRGIISCHIYFCRLLTVHVCMIPALSMLLSPTSVILYK